MDDRIRSREGVLGLAEVGQIGDQAQPEGTAVVPRVHVEDVVAMLAQVAHDPRSALAAASRDDDSHADLLAGQVWPSGRAEAVPLRGGCILRRDMSGNVARRAKVPSSTDGTRRATVA